jgi:hypothetical protein
MPLYKILQFGLVGMEALACMAGIMHWKKIRTTYWKWFVVYLGVIVISEIIGLSLLYMFENGGASRDLYNYFVIPLEFLFFFWLYYRYFETSRARYLPLAGTALYVCAWLVNLVIYPGLNFWEMPLPYLAGVIVMLLLVIAYFSRLIFSDKILAYKTDIMFWVSVGVLVFYLVSSPYHGLRWILYYKYPDLFWIYFYTQFAVNYLMYTFFTIGLIWGNPR